MRCDVVRKIPGAAAGLGFPSCLSLSLTATVPLAGLAWMGMDVPPS